MIEAIQLVGAPSFAAGTNIGNFAACTFVFGSNGSGKTTISRAFSDPSRFPGTSVTSSIGSDPMVIKVYNRDYVELNRPGFYAAVLLAASPGDEPISRA